jgi:cytochrome oxidase Cu insertion factor (SCO1/SenC/PrrC family)
MENHKSAFLRRLLFAGCMLIAAAGLAAYALMSTPGGMPGHGTPQVGGAFSMIDQTGKPVTEKTYMGKPMLVFFGFTYCPDICPTQLQVIAEALKQLGNKGADIQPVFVSVDTARDTPDVLKSYVENFGTQFIGLTGSTDQVKNMAQTYKVFFEKKDNKDAPDQYTMDHSSTIYLMGADGVFVKHFNYTTDAQELAQGIAAALGR